MDQQNDFLSGLEEIFDKLINDLNEVIDEYHKNSEAIEVYEVKKELPESEKDDGKTD